VVLARQRTVAEIIANVLAGSWRPSPPTLDLSGAELERALPLIERTSAAGLCWWRLRGTAFASLAGVRALQDAYRYAALEAELHQLRLISVLRALRAASVEPILIKGWDNARFYPQPGLRPYEDIDLVVQPAEIELAQATLDANETSDAIVDLVHLEIDGLDAVAWNALYGRSSVAPLAGADVRVLAREDHLRAICIHSLKHGILNPLWLCDIAMHVELTGPDFDWARCFGNQRPQSQWIGCAIGLARDLLGCKVPAQAASRIGPVPRWLVAAVLDAWTTWATAGFDERPPAVRELVEKPTRIAEILVRRWPSGIAVALRRGAPLDDPPFARRLHELNDLLASKRIVRAASRLPAAWRRTVNPAE
jgi:hypothetical protein